MSYRVITGDCIEEMRKLDKVDVCIFDPPYSEHVHKNVHTGTCDPRKGKVGNDQVDLGFSSISIEWMLACAAGLSRIVKRWNLVFCDVESAHLWADAFEKSGLELIRIGSWERDGAPQVSGDRPAVGFECIVITHRPGRKRWNGGGRPARWRHQTCHANRVVGSNNTREHPTQKPLPLMVELVSLFSDPGETVLDCCAGVSTTGVAAVRLGRHYIGIEQQEKWAQIGRERLEAEAVGGDVVSYRAGQLTMFGKSKGAKQ